MRTRVQPDILADRKSSYSLSRQRLKERCVSSPLLFCIGTAMVDLTLQHLVADPDIFSGLVYLQGAQESEDGNLEEETPLE